MPGDPTNDNIEVVDDVEVASDIEDVEKTKELLTDKRNEQLADEIVVQKGSELQAPQPIKRKY